MALIGIDCRFASKPVGLGTYTRELVLHLIHSSTDSFVLFVRSLDEQWLDDVPSHTAVVTADCDHYSLKEQIHIPRLIRALHIDLFFSPHFNVPYFCPVPFVVTIHDLILHRYPNQTSLIKRLAYHLLMRRAVRKAEHVIAVSNYTGSELTAVYTEALRSKMSVLTEGVNPLFTHASADPSVLKKHGITTPYFLYVGNAKQHKNVQMLVDAHKQLDDQSYLVLVCSGSEARRLQLHDNVLLLQDVPLQDLPSLYAQAKCFVTASLYEGFCLPVLEARASGCPVIATNQTAIPEVAGSSAMLVPPTVLSYAEAMRAPPTNSTPPEQRYSWESVAIDTAGILSSAAHG